MNGEGLFAIVGTIFGFLLFVTWDEWKEHERKSEERKRIIGLLKTELLDNLDICRNSKEILSHELRSIEETKMSCEYPLIIKAYNFRLIEMISTLEAEIKDVLTCLS